MNKSFSLSISAFLLALILVVCSTGTAFAAGTDSSPRDLTSSSGWPDAPEIESECAIVMEAKTGSILYAKNMNEVCYPASITKIMTALVVLENCSLDEILTFSYHATHDLEEGSTSIARTEGEEMSVRDCLYALLLVSANEVAQGLAEYVGGTIEDFVDMMNAKAVELGCTNTHFTNPSGLNDSDHYTTCRDMAIIMQAAVQNPDFLTIDSTLSYTIPATNKHDEELPIANKHQLVQNTGNHYDGAVAGKTGYTTIALNTLVTYAVRGDMELICVVMKSKSSHYTDTVSLLDYGFDNFTMYRLSDTDISSVISDDAEDLSGAVIPGDAWLVLPNSLSLSDLTASLERSAEGETDEEGNTTLGTIRYSYDGTEFGTAPLTKPAVSETNITETAAEETQELTTEEAVGRTAQTPAQEDSGFFGRIKRLPGNILSSLRSLWSRLQGPYRLLLLVPIILLVLIILLVRSIIIGNRRNRRASVSPHSISYRAVSSPRKHGHRRRRKKYKF